MIDRVRAARRDPDLAVLEGFHALKHALRFGAEVEAVVATDPDELERLARELAPDLAGRFRDLAVRSRRTSCASSRRSRRAPAWSRSPAGRAST